MPPTTPRTEDQAISLLSATAQLLHDINKPDRKLTAAMMAGEYISAVRHFADGGMLRLFLYNPECVQIVWGDDSDNTMWGTATEVGDMIAMWTLPEIFGTYVSKTYA